MDSWENLSNTFIIKEAQRISTDTWQEKESHTMEEFNNLCIEELSLTNKQHTVKTSATPAAQWKAG